MPGDCGENMMIPQTQNVSYYLRKRGSQDEPFLLQLYMAQQQEVMRSWGWDIAQQQVFLEMQYRARNAGYATAYPDSVSNIICDPDQVSIGRMLISNQQKAIHLVDIALLPAYQRRGIGTQVLSDLQKRGMTEGKKITLQVPCDSSARRLYVRLGFQLIRQDPVYVQMEWST